MLQESLKVLVADDSAIFRKKIADLLRHIQCIGDIHTAYNGKVVIEKLPVVQPDLVIMDMDMPNMDGLETLRHIRRAAPHIVTVLITSDASQIADLSFQALHKGALDLLLKPDDAESRENMDLFRHRLTSLVQLVLERKKVRSLLRGVEEEENVPTQDFKPGTKGHITKYGKVRHEKIEVVGIAASTGGPLALKTFIPRLPPDLNVPVLIVQHMPPAFTTALAESLDRVSSLNVMEGSSGQILLPNNIYIAPGGRHMKVIRESAKGMPKIAITDDPLENFCRPSADYLFRSLADVYGGKALGVIMTGMGHDGVNGLKAMKMHNAPVIAQDEETSVVFGMNAEAIRANVVDRIVPLELIAETISSFAHSSGD